MVNSRDTTWVAQPVEFTYLVLPLIKRLFMQYLVVIEKTATGYSAYVPDLPGCVTVGDTKEEIKNYMAEAIQLHLDGLREDGLEVPSPSTEAVMVAA